MSNEKENDLAKYRADIDQIDKQMAQLFERRLECAKQIAKYKKEHKLPIYDSNRENEVILRNSLYIKDEKLRGYYVDFLEEVMGTSKKIQAKIIGTD